MSKTPLPMDWNALQEPPELDFSMPDDPFPTVLFADDAFDYLPGDDAFNPLSMPEPVELDVPAVAAQPVFNADEGWGWHDAGIIAVERTTLDHEGERYSIGAIDLYANAHSGDLGGSYLEIGTFGDLDQAAAFYHELQNEIHNQRLLPFQLTDFAHERAAKRAAELGESAPTWGVAGPAEYAAYDEMRSLDAGALLDLPPDDFEFEDLFNLENEPAPAVEMDIPAFKALRDIGIAAESFDPNTDPPPFVDPETGTAYWIGVFQPDKDDPSNCVTSILSLGRDPKTDEVEAQLAPCVPGEWDKAYGAAEYLLNVVERDGIERAFEAAEGMALAADQRGLWEGERGIPLEPDTAQDLADYTRDLWEIDL